MSQNFIASLKHGGMVALHIIAALVVTSIGYLLTTGNADLVNLLTHYGLPVGIVNIIIATAYSYYQKTVTK